MLQQQIQRKQKSFMLQRGLYVLRYESSVDASRPPLVTVACEAGRNEVILHPEQARATMSAPGQALVIRATESGNVQVEIASSASTGALDATLKFEQLRPDTGWPAGLAGGTSGFGEPATPYLASPAAKIQLLGHVARLGDVVVGPDEWLGGLSAPARIEGFLVRWPGKPADVQLRYAATIAGQRPGEARLVEVDEYTGTRGRARPLVGLTAELIGPGAGNYQLTVEALFLGAPTRRMTGPSLAVAGPTGREPLVGLRMSLAGQKAVPQQPTRQTIPQDAWQVAGRPSAGQQGGQAAAADPRRVRVFRA
jgi:hypothetical protein